MKFCQDVTRYGSLRTQEEKVGLSPRDSKVDMLSNRQVLEIELVLIRSSLSEEELR